MWLEQFQILVDNPLQWWQQLSRKMGVAYVRKIQENLEAHNIQHGSSSSNLLSISFFFRVYEYYENNAYWEFNLTINPRISRLLSVRKGWEHTGSGWIIRCVRHAYFPICIVPSDATAWHEATHESWCNCLGFQADRVPALQLRPTNFSRTVIRWFHRQVRLSWRPMADTGVFYLAPKAAGIMSRYLHRKPFQYRSLPLCLLLHLLLCFLPCRGPF